MDERKKKGLIPHPVTEKVFIIIWKNFTHHLKKITLIIKDYCNYNTLHVFNVVPKTLIGLEGG